MNEAKAKGTFMADESAVKVTIAASTANEHALGSLLCFQSFCSSLMPRPCAVAGGWGLSYADLSPATPRTPAGQAFLATNLGYAVVGAWLAAEGDCLYGGLTEAAGLVSFAYHYAQLDLGKNRPEVRLALLVDYLVAGAALLTGTAYLVQDCAAGGAGLAATSGTTLASAAVALGCLGLCWVWEYGYPYIFLHSLWHIASAYTGFLVGQEHLDTIASL